MSDDPDLSRLGLILTEDVIEDRGARPGRRWMAPVTIVAGVAAAIVVAVVALGGGPAPKQIGASPRDPVVDPTTPADLSDPAEPEWRAYAAIAAGPAGILVNGGQGDSGVLDDTWVLGAGLWSAAGGRVPPPLATGASLDFVPSLGGYLRFGGSSRRVTPFCPTSCAIPELAAEIWLYDPDSDSWNVISAGGPLGRFGHGSAQADGEDLLVVFGGVGRTGDSGFRAGGILHDTWVLEVAETRWVEIDAADGPQGRVYHGMVHDDATGLVYMWGGRTADRDGDAQMWAFDPTERRWSVAASGDGPPARWRHAMVVDAAGRVVVIGGERFVRAATSTNLLATEEVWAWDPSGGWSRLADLPEPMVGVAAAVDGEGRIVAVTDHGVLVYDQDRWTPLTADG